MDKVELRARGKTDIWKSIKAAQLERLARRFQRSVETLLDHNIEKMTLKQPAWSDFQDKLLKVCKEKHTSDGAADRLIHLLFHTLFPQWIEEASLTLSAIKQRRIRRARAARHT